jgi:hypothetical protein
MLSAHLPSVLLLLQKRRVAAGSGLGTGLGTMIKYVRRTASGAAGNSPGTTVKDLWQSTAAGSRLATRIKYLRGAAVIGLGTTDKYCTQCLCMEPELPPCSYTK